MNILINPGSGDINKETSYENAYKNILQYISDCEIPLEIQESKHYDRGGRYTFELMSTDLTEIRFEIDMPGLPLEQVRYMSDTEQSIFDFPRIYVDGSSWIWYIGVIKKENFKENLEYRIEEARENIERYKKVIAGFKETTNEN